MKIILQAPIVVRFSSRVGRVLAIQSGLLLRSLVIALYIWVASENYDKLSFSLSNRNIYPIEFSGRILEIPVYYTGCIINYRSGTFLFNEVPVRLGLQQRSIAVSQMVFDATPNKPRRSIDVYGTLFFTEEFSYHMKLAIFVYFFLLNLFRIACRKIRAISIPSSP